MRNGNTLPLPSRRLGAAIATALAAMYVAGQPMQALATTRNVTNCADSGPGSLRATIVASASGDTVDMTGLTCSKITLGGTELVVGVDSLSIRGPGSSLLKIDAAAQSRVLRHNGVGTLGISGLTITHGRYDYASPGTTGGGCIFSAGSVVATDVSVTQCAVHSTNSTVAVAIGGGIAAMGNLALVRSRLSGNLVHAAHGAALGGGAYSGGSVNIKYSSIDGNNAVADAGPPFGSPHSSGGGLFVYAGGKVRNSTISGNGARTGAGADFGSGGGLIEIANSTISGNDAVESNGGLSLGSATLYNSTIAFNHEATKYASGVFVRDSGSLDLQSTIIAMNTAGSATTGIDLKLGTAAGLTGSHNLVRLSAASLPPGTLHDDPLLGPLADNGGPTRTHAIGPDSPALDAGNNMLPLSTDQRGAPFRREAGMAADIGAFELDDTIFADGFD